MIDVEKEEYVDMNPYENHDDIEGKNNNDFSQKELYFLLLPIMLVAEGLVETCILTLWTKKKKRNSLIKPT